VSRQTRRLDTGGLIDRDRPLKFTFDGRPYAGCAGDTLASALLANDVMLVGRSYKYHRPRGILTAGVEEPNAIVTLGADAHIEPNLRATAVELRDGLRAKSQNGRPSLKFDMLSVNSLFSGMLSAGFYYKTFMWPQNMWPFYEKLIRRAASDAECPGQRDPSRYACRHAHCDVLVVGAGPAGLAAAQTAARSGARVILVDDQPRPGGSLLHDADAEIDSLDGIRWAESVAKELASNPDVIHLQRTVAAGYYDYNYVVAVESVGDHLAGADADPRLPRHRTWKIRAKQSVIAAGAIERPLLFRNNDLPGVMMADALEKYVRRYAVLPGSKVVLYANNDSAYRCAVTAAEAGAQVIVLDPRPDPGAGGWPAKARDMSPKVEVRPGHALIKAHGRMRVSMASSARVDSSAGHAFNPDEATKDSCDLIAVSGGWTPTVHLFSQSGGKLAFDEEIGAFVPKEANPISPARCAGAAAGAFSLGKCISQGMAAAASALIASGREKPTAKPPEASQTSAGSWAAPFVDLRIAGEGGDGEKGPGIVARIAGMVTGDAFGGKTFVDYMLDVTADDVRLAEREGYGAAEHMKRYTAAGFGTDQGKTGNVNALRILAAARGSSPQELGHTTFRPMYAPVPFGALAGTRIGETYLPRRKTPIHPWHDANGAVYEHVGDWLRPRYFTTKGESMDEAVRRECLAAREGVGMMDASTLGKIDVRGPDAGEFLDMVYTNRFSSLEQDRGRYGVMLDENGMIFDDGVTFRLGENHFHMTTTTGGAARVLSWLEGWLQTEWPDKKVWCTSVTDQWSVIALAGPQSRRLLGELTDLPLDSDSFPFMSCRDGVLAGVPARLYRVSFSGELAYEINVAAGHGRYVWEKLLEYGGAHNVTPYGTEAMHVLRAEKGFIIVGQDTDGTRTPDDMGMRWIVSPKKDDFLGKRSLARADTAREDRHQLVGLLTEDPKKVIQEGAHLLDSSVRLIPANMQGYVTSSYMSPSLDRSIALAMVKAGRSRIGENLFAAKDAEGEMIPVRVVEPVFYDKDGEKLRG